MTKLADDSDTSLARLLLAVGRLPVEVLRRALDAVRADPNTDLATALERAGLVSRLELETLFLPRVRSSGAETMDTPAPRHETREVRTPTEVLQAVTLADLERAESSLFGTPHESTPPLTGDGGELERAFNDPTRRLGPYRLLSVLGRGGMGVVLKAVDPKLRRTVAIKQIRGGASDRSLARFEREAQLMAKLDHPGIARVHEVVVEGDGAPYMVMDYVEGLPLYAICGAPNLTPSRIAEIGLGIAEAIAHAHERGVVHRDLKPGNVVLTPAGEPILLDFGLGRSLKDDWSQSLTVSGAGGLGTPAYMPPEQIDRPKYAGPLADVYGLGTILYALMTGLPPFKGGQLELIAAIKYQDPVPPSKLRKTIAPDLETVCLKCMQKHPDDRYPSADAVAAELRRFLGAESVEARPVPEVQRVARNVRRRVSGPAAAIGVALAAIVVGSVLWATFGGGDVADELAEERERAAQREHDLAQGRAEQAALKDGAAALVRLTEVLQYRYRPEGTADEEERLVANARADVSAALTTLRGARERGPLVADLHVYEGRGYLALHEYGAAIAAADAALALDGELAGAWGLKGRALMARLALEDLAGFKGPEQRDALAAEALACFERARARGDARDPLGEFLTRVAAGDLDRAEAALQGPGVLSVPAEEVSYAYASLEFLQQPSGGAFATEGAERDAVLAHVEDALRACPRHLPSLVLRGAMRSSQGMQGLAEQDFTRVLQLKPNLVLAYNCRGLARMLLDRPREGLQDMEEALRLEPGIPMLHNNRALLRAQVGDYRGAREDLDEAIRLSPEPSADFHFNRGNTWLPSKNFVRAEIEFDRALELGYRDPAVALRTRGLARSAMVPPKLKGALADFDAAIALEPRPITYYNRALVKKRLGDPDGGLADVGVAIDSAPKGHEELPRFLIYRAQELNRLGREPRLAIADLTTAIDLLGATDSARTAQAYANRARLKLKLEDAGGAALDFEQSLRHDPQQKHAARLRTFIEKELGRPSEF